MEYMVARQPILDAQQATYGYELLFRNSLSHNAFTGSVDGNTASLTVIANSFMQMGIGSITDGKKAFVNFTRELLLAGYAEMLPKDLVVIEILEDIVCDAPVLQACARLHQNGYTLALDDYVGVGDYEALLPYIQIIKADFLGMTVQQRGEVGLRLSARGIRMLAEKVETREDFEFGLRHGYTLFQGYFFDRPAIMSSCRPQESKLSRLRLLQEVARKDTNITNIEDIIKHDPALATKLLRYMNSMAFGLRHEVKAVRQALVLLGEHHLRKWVSVLVASSLSDDKPSELLRQTVLRARFCELLATPCGHADAADELFMCGLFSTLDAIMDQPIADVLAELPVSDGIRQALLHRQGFHAEILDFVIAIETGDFSRIIAMAEQIGIDEVECGNLYTEAIRWADSVVDA